MPKSEKKIILDWLTITGSAAKTGDYQAFYKRLNALLMKPARSRKAVSIYKLNRCTKEGDNVVVPTKVLSQGKMDHKINIAALECSSGAMTALKSSGCKLVTLKEMQGQKRISVIM